MLANIDATQGDDQLLLQMCGAAKETLIPESSFDFVVKILKSRLFDQFFFAENILMMLDLTKLPIQARTILLDTVAGVVRQDSCNSLMLLFAQLPCMLSEQTTATITLCFSAHDSSCLIHIFKRVFEGCGTLEHRQDESVLCVTNKLRPIFDYLTIEGLYDSLYRLFSKRIYENNKGGVCTSLPECVEIHRWVHCTLIRRTRDIFANRMLNDLTKEVVWSGRHDDITFFLCKHRHKSQEGEWEEDLNSELRTTVNLMLQRPDIVLRCDRFLYDPSCSPADFINVIHITVINTTTQRTAHRLLLLMEGITAVMSPATMATVWYSIFETAHSVLQDFDEPCGDAHWGRGPRTNLVLESVFSTLLKALSSERARELRRVQRIGYLGSL
ncbi:hypothetical protein BDW22DRAFT_822284 [Trametopsis cervina]|nr:hypothetical protein BDW22DRAFT_822284 [Trametopsis cervina]